MLNKVSLKNETMLVNDLKMISQAYEEIAVMKMQKVRSNVLQTREFFTELLDVFFEVKASYKKQIERIIAQKKNHNVNSVEQKNGKKAFVFLSANGNLYGPIIKDVLAKFLADTEKESGEIVIIGRMGKQFFEERRPGKKYTYFDLPDADVTMEDMQKIAQYLSEYETVKVYYGKFLNVMTQSPDASDITAQTQAEHKDDAVHIDAFFEPSLELVLIFFENQVLDSLFKQTVHEAELARFASRLKAMEEALQNIDKKQRDLKREEWKIRHRLENKKMLESIKGISFWTK